MVYHDALGLRLGRFARRGSLAAAGRDPAARPAMRAAKRGRRSFCACPARSVVITVGRDRNFTPLPVRAIRGPPAAPDAVSGSATPLVALPDAASAAGGLLPRHPAGPPGNGRPPGRSRRRSSRRSRPRAGTQGWQGRPSPPPDTDRPPASGGRTGGRQAARPPAGGPGPNRSAGGPGALSPRGVGRDADRRGAGRSPRGGCDPGSPAPGRLASTSTPIRPQKFAPPQAGTSARP